MDQITSPAKKGNLLKATFVRCYICGKRKQAITWLNPCIDATIGTEELGHHLQVIWLLGASLLQLVSYPSEQSMQWLLELMGHAKNVAYEKVTDVKVTNHRMATQFMMYAFTTAVVVWSTKELVLSTGFTSCLRGLASSYERDAASSLSSVPSTSAPVHMFIGNEKYKELILSQMSVHLPLAICSLLSKQPWAELTEKVLDWLIVMYEAPIGNMTDTCRNMLKESMYALRHFPEARKISYWTRLYKT
uniref:Focadhesin-like n=1 Tax=Saccoglossus kowalevskii TaxID=10224 RepID=A0ABM0MPC8_SACKO|nr:PREDICTED: focadhesin-like [Saccoglossus kowalevskii]